MSSPRRTEAGLSTTDSSASDKQVTLRFHLLVVWILASAFNYGYGISELNPLQPILTCSDTSAGCMGLTESQFGLITALFTLGGLTSSFLISPISSSLGWGRKQCIMWSAVSGILGSLLLSLAGGLSSMGLGRFIQGIGSGIGVVIVPIYLNEISPVSMQGSVGVLNQLSIVVGVFTAQAMGGSPLGSGSSTWRIIPSLAGLVSIVQLIGTFVIALESPVWLEMRSSANTDADQIRKTLWSLTEVQASKQRADASRHQGDAAHVDADDDDERRGLLTGNQGHEQQSAKVGLTSLFSDPEIRPGVFLVALTQLGQQLSGINAVLYYSVGIMSTILPTMAGSIGVFITLVNIVMTFVPMFLIDEARVGRRNLMVGSALVMSLSSFVLGTAIVAGYKALAAVSLSVFVAGFALGLGPIPFVILPELVPSRAVSAATSLGLTLNWSANFIVGSAFLPLRTWLSDWDTHHTGGSVFYIFAVINFVTALLVYKTYRYTPAS